MRTKPLALVVGFVLLSLSPSAEQAQQYGPPKGTLVIGGGGSTEGTGIVEEFIALAGGVDKKFVIVPTAGGNDLARAKSWGGDTPQNKQ